jgi:RNA polymerase sigma-70 factor (sigma-E family)
MQHDSRHAREEAEFREFASRFSPRLLRAALLILRDAETAPDVVQTTLLQTLRRWGRARTAPEPYSRRVLVNVCKNHWRYRARHPETPSEDASLIDAAVSEAGGIDERVTLDALLAQLPARQRAVLVLRFYLDLSVTETADLLGLPEGTVKSATHRGLDRLRVLLDDQPQEILKSC